MGSLYVEEDKIRGDWKLYFSSKVDPKHIDNVKQIRARGGTVPRALLEQSREYHGVAIMVHERWWHNIVDVRPGGAIIISLTLKPNQKLKVIAAYAPHAVRPAEEKGAFYEELSVAFSTGGKGGMTIVCGDFNARLGRPVNGEESRIIGKYGYAERDLADEALEVQENREMLMQFCKLNKLVAANTHFEKSTKEQITYRRPGTPVNAPIDAGGYEQIDSIISSKV